MSKKVIVTEKPSVAKQFASALGVRGSRDGYIENEEWIITWCIGHLAALSMPEKYDEGMKKWRLDTLPFLPRSYKYEVLQATSKQFKIVKDILRREDVEKIYNAGDSGREGEYIQRLVYQMAGVPKSKEILRVWIDSQTDAEIIRGIKEAKPSSEYDRLAAAAYERGIADYAVGINLSRAFSCKFGRAFNTAAETSRYIPMAVGRVMTCVLGMIVEREREIRDFTPVDYYKIDADHGGWRSHWKAVKGTRFAETDALYNDSGLKEKVTAEALVQELNTDSRLTVEKVEKKKEKQQAPALFNLAELQAECTKRFKISPARTLEIVQSLYEKKATTYPRTDARVLSTAVANEIEANLKGVADITEWSAAQLVLQNGWHKDLAKRTGKKYVDDSKITDHYAIIPTGQGKEELRACSEIEKRVYTLIVKRFLAIFFPPAVYDKVSIELRHANGEAFFANEKNLVEKGFRAIYKEAQEGKDKEKPEEEKSGLDGIKKGDVLSCTFEVSTSTTQPPKRYTSGSLILAMEGAGKLIDDQELREQIKGSGIGTSATRAEIISKLEKNEYIAADPKTQILTPTKLGESMYDIVRSTVPQLLSPKMTASWEKGLAMIEGIGGRISAEDYRIEIEKFVRISVDRIKSAQTPGSVRQADEGDRSRVFFSREPVGKCPRCGRDVVEGEKGFGCVGYRDRENPCHFTLWKSSRLLETAHKSISADEAKYLLEGKSIVVKGLISKKNRKYDAKFKLVDDGKYANLEMSVDGIATHYGGQ